MKNKNSVPFKKGTYQSVVVIYILYKMNGQHLSTSENYQTRNNSPGHFDGFIPDGKFDKNQSVRDH